MIKKLLLGAAALIALGAAPPANALVVGTADTSNSIPFGSTTGGGYFQQVYDAASFDDPMGLYRLTFYNTLSPDTDTPRTGRFEVFLSVVNTTLSTFDTSNSLTVPYFDASFVKVFDGALPALKNGRLDLNFDQGFKYDPSAGQLMVTIRSFDFGSGDLFMDVDTNATATNSRMSSFGYDWNQGLVTGFNSAVPEPGVWGLMIAGFGLAGATLRRRRRAVAA